MQTAIVTGASRGIGKAIALKLAELQYNLVVVGRTAQLLDQLKSEIEKAGGRCLALEADLTQKNAPRNIIEESVAHFGQIDVLVNNALTGFTKVLAKEVQKDGIRVHLISPGGVNTEMVREMRPDIDVEQLIQPEEIAEVVEFLVTRKGRGTIDHLYIRRQSGLAFD